MLLVEDDPTIRSLIEDVLQEDVGVAVQVAADGAVGLEMARKLRPDLILLDINLPKLSGLEVARRLKADRRTQAIPIVAVTCASHDEVLAAGCDAFLGKPFDLDEMTAMTMRYVT